jgi:hypothetical protein
MHVCSPVEAKIVSLKPCSFLDSPHDCHGATSPHYFVILAKAVVGGSPMCLLARLEVKGVWADIGTLLALQQVILSFVNNWGTTGGVDEYVGWANGSGHESFFSDPNSMQLYQNYVQTVINRVNTINGRKYGDDPTIFAW